jgi:hypothetical protein
MRLLFSLQKGEPSQTEETLVKPFILHAAKIVLGESNKDKLKKISLSDSTVKHLTDALAEDIKLQSSRRGQIITIFCYEL